MCSSTVSMAVSSVIPSPGVGNLVLIFLFFLFFLFGGNLVNITTMPESLKWLAYVSFIKYAYPSGNVCCLVRCFDYQRYEGLLINEMKGVQLLFNAPGYPSFYLDGNIIIDQLSVDVRMLVPDIFILIGMIVWYILWSYIFLRFVVRERR